MVTTMEGRQKARIVGALIMFFNLWLIGEYNISGLPVLLMTVGFVVAYEVIVVRGMFQHEAKKGSNPKV